MKYLDYIKQSMDLLYRNDYYFVGQSVLFPGTGLYHTIKHLPADRRLELPIFEDIQAGISLGMNLENFKVCCIYPRFDFLVIALNEILTHLDRLEELSGGDFKPTVIIRTAIGSVKPLFPGVQHNSDYTEALKLMTTNIDIVKLTEASEIFCSYQRALTSGRSTILIEIPDLYESEA